MVSLLLKTICCSCSCIWSSCKPRLDHNIETGIIPVLFSIENISSKLWKNWNNVRRYTWHNGLIKDYPLKIACQSIKDSSTSTRAMTRGRPIEIGKSALTSNSCVGDAIKIWNQAPNDIKNCETLSQLKKAAKAYAKTLPI